jgi:serine/threonine protein kinase/tetratricopeptide (TPR) repeat protein
MAESPTAVAVPSAAASNETLGRYRLLEPIGRGGMAEVFKAKSFGVEGFEKVLVIKRIVPELAAHQEFVEMFVREAKLAVRLSHSNIVQVFDLGRVEHPGEAAPSYFIAMEYVAGCNLATLLNHFRRSKQLPPLGLATFVSTEVAKALDHAHRRTGEDARPLGIVHRDISPHNVLLSWDGDVKVTDFGIAKAADFIARDELGSELEAGRATGKIAFMSPEQSRAEHTDARSDLFSLGVVMYEVITGANPFGAPTLSETIRRIQAGEYPPPTLLRPETPQALVDIVQKLLKPRAEERLQSAAELCDELLAFAYTGGERFGAADLGALLAPLREGPEPMIDLDAHGVLDEPSAAVDQTPVEVPQVSQPPPAPMSRPRLGERREVSTLVVCFGGRGATQASAELLDRVREVLDRHGAWLEEVTPSQVVAIFGLGDTDGRDAEAAVRAGLVLVRERRFGAVPSAGVHSGPISVDEGGIPVRDERLASLLATTQGLARAAEGRVVLSPLAGRLARRSFVTEPLSDAARAVAEGGLVVRAARDDEGLRGRFAGRRHELKALGAIFAAATRQGPQLVALRGETGIGKSRLLVETKRRLERGNYSVALYAATCPVNGVSAPWSGLSAMLHVLCGTQEDDDPERILEVRPRLRALALREEQADAVLALLGAPLPQKAGEMRAVLRDAFERMVTSLCRDKIHCFAWDDAQSLDEETLGAILRVLRRSQSLRGVFILAQRGELPPAVAGHKRLRVVELGELGERDASRLLESLLDVRAVPAELSEYVRRCAGGHPLFIDELIRELVDTGAAQLLGDRVVVGAQLQASAPRTLRTLIADRVSRLHGRERRVLGAVATLGEPASTPVLASVIDQPLPATDRYVATLEGKGLLRRTGPTQVRFASPLYQEIVLDAMPPGARQELHRLAAQAWQQVERTAGPDVAERIADHLLGAGERSGAVDYFWKSARRKLEIGQLEPALRAMLRGLELADASRREVSELAGWLRETSTTVSKVRQAPGLREAAAPALREIDARGSARERLLAHVDMARALGSVNLFEDGYQALDKTDPGALADVELRRAILTAEAQLAGRQGNFARAARAVDALEALGPSDDPEVLMTVALARCSTGQCPRALELMDRVDQLAPTSDAVEAVTRQKHRVLIYFNMRDFAAAARSAAELAQLARAAGLRFDTAAALHNLGDASDRHGDRPRAYAAFVESLELCRQLEHDRLTNLNQMHVCFLDGLRGQTAAEERLKSLIRYADGHGYLWDVLEGRLLLGRLCAERGDRDGARKKLEEVVAMAEEHGHSLIGDDAREMLKTLGGA